MADDRRDDEEKEAPDGPLDASSEDQETPEEKPADADASQAEDAENDADDAAPEGADDASDADATDAEDDSDEKKSSKPSDESEADEADAKSEEDDAPDSDEKKSSKPSDESEADEADAKSEEDDAPDSGKAEAADGGKGGDDDRVSVIERPKEEPEGAAWGRPLKKIDTVWTSFEMRLCALVLGLEIFSLTTWVFLKGMSSRTSDTDSAAGVVFRAVIGAVILGAIAYFALKKVGRMQQRVAGMIGIAIGLFTGRLWADVGVEWSANMLNWYQQASTLTLVGGLRGVGTRLTLMLALLGGSLATGAGKHITIDVLTRMIKPQLRKPVLVVGWLGTAAICFIAAWGFFDFVSIEAFGASANTEACRVLDEKEQEQAKESSFSRWTTCAGEKFDKTGEGLSEAWFILRKQVALDFKTLPHVLGGEPYANWLTGKEYNEFVRTGGWEERFGKEKMEKLLIPDDAKRAPMIVIPGKGEPRGELSNAANLVFPIGLFIIGLRFILLSLLVVSGHKPAEPEDDDAFQKDTDAGGSDDDAQASGDSDGGEDEPPDESADEKKDEEAA